MTEPRSNIDVNALLLKSGLADATIEAVRGIDGVLQTWRRRANKRELGQRALRELNVGLELAQLDVLMAIDAPIDETQGGGETMISTVAERLTIDPSRASRLVTDMVDAGYAQRAVSQADARRTIIELTATGKAVVDAVRAYKFMIMGDYLRSWSQEELATFLPLLHRFGQWSDHTEMGANKFAEDIALLAQQIAANRKQT